MASKKPERRVEAVVLAAQGDAEIEAEAVDMEGGDPVAQGIHHHLQDARRREVQRVAGAGVVDAVARIVGNQAVVARIVEAAERQRRAQLAALGGVVVDDVEDDLEAGGMQAADGDAHLVEGVVGEIARLGREEADGVVAPVVAQALLQQGAVLHEGVDRQQLHRGDAEPPHVIDEMRIAQRGEGAALVGLRSWRSMLRPRTWTS